MVLALVSITGKRVQIIIPNLSSLSPTGKMIDLITIALVIWREIQLIL